MDILLTNDDGIQAVGLRAMYHALVKAGHTVYCYAPVSEQSAVGHAITFALPLRVKEFREDGFKGFGVYGTPSDCVKLALTSLLQLESVLVISGINAGANVGVDILYSGTVAAATEGAMLGARSLAVSHDDFNHTNLTGQAEYTVELLDKLPWDSLPPLSVLNLNFPNRPMELTKELVVCPHTKAMYQDWYISRTDPRGRSYYWLDGVIPPDKPKPHTDRALLNEGYITLTPLRFDFNDQETLESLKKSMG